MTEDLSFATLYQARALEHVLERLRTSTPADSQERATLVAYLEKLLPGPPDPESETRKEFVATALARRERYMRDPSSAVPFDVMLAKVQQSLAAARAKGLLPATMPVEQLSFPRDVEICLVLARWDAEAGVWVATSEDVPGLASEAETLKALRDKLRELVPELLRANAAKGLAASGGAAPDMQDVPRRRPEPENPDEP
jgi:hypothetical protein